MPTVFNLRPALATLPRPAALGAAIAIAIATAIGGIAGCELSKRNQEAQDVINARVVGMPAGDFFDKYGAWRARSELADGATAYNWESPVGKAPAGVYGLDERICRLRVIADKRGRVATVEIRFDNTGIVSTSRCTEIFKGG